MNRVSISTTLTQPHWKLRSPPWQRSAEFSEKLDKFHQKPEALNEDELDDLVEECLSDGDDNALRGILPYVKTLHIRPDIGSERAWWTLLSAMPKPSPITMFTVYGNSFNNDTASLFLQAMSRMPELHNLHIVHCDWNVALGDLTCLALPQLQSFSVVRTRNSLSLLTLILDVQVSQPGRVRVSSNPGMKNEDHAALAKLLSAQAKAKLSNLSLTCLLAGEYANENLALRDRPLANVLGHYTGLLKDETTTLKYLDLGDNPLGPESCMLLHGAFGASTAPITLSLESCWGAWRRDQNLWDCVGELIQLPRFVEIILRGNAFPEEAKAVFEGLAKNEGLQHLDLQDAAISSMIWADLSMALTTMKITTLDLPEADDRHYGHLLHSMETNEWLHTVHVPDIERKRLWWTPALFGIQYRDYLALMDCVHRNWLKWQGSVESVKNGMAQVLAHFGSFEHQGPRNDVPDDVARYAAWWSLQMNGAQTRAVSALNKRALPKD
jgi:hypothetical protein